ncbi:uncharacterized protein LOC129001118 isoform X1 [Macrosteles quadrilineatus]|uniref:uncharacterized protein LOC129001118 isoform X1 n=1 Tax=Macrosteles quadrilineatus TaxID=74068 RepID=UPI0023E20B72|nr:uncharacterized protein LOC129001118 isoform X1 [Macrosteles quadrilineatus]
MFKSFLLPCCRYVIPASCLKQAKRHLKLGLLITFQYQTIRSRSHCLKPRNKNTTFGIQMAENMSTDASSGFTGTVDRYKGVHISSVENPSDLVTFTSKLEASLNHWVAEKMLAVWFLVSLEQSDWIPVLTKNCFRFHHTGCDGSTVSLVRWLDSSPSRVPVFAHTMVGVGAVVVDKDGRLLVVQESYRGQPYWKLPGGYVEPGEDISVAAMREVQEETNIVTEFKSLIAFRHSHSAQFGCSDLYFIVELAPLSSTITSCEVEIEDSQWMDMDTYLSHPNVHENNRLFVRKYLFSKEKGLSINGTKTLHPVTKAPQTLFALGDIE